MKNVCIIALLLISFTGFSQMHGQHPRNGMKGMDLTPQQQATLSSKHLALTLDLTEKQQNQVMQLQLQRAEERKALLEERMKNQQVEKESPDPEERFNRINSRLDRQLAYKAEMKKILTESQYNEWKQIRGHMARMYHDAHGHTRKNKR